MFTIEVYFKVFSFFKIFSHYLIFAIFNSCHFQFLPFSIPAISNMLFCYFQFLLFPTNPIFLPFPILAIFNKSFFPAISNSCNLDFQLLSIRSPAICRDPCNMRSLGVYVTTDSVEPIIIFNTSEFR